MKKQKLNYRFHDPNDPAVTIESVYRGKSEEGGGSDPKSE